MKLELGSGDRPYRTDDPDWQHNDTRELQHIEFVGDAFDPIAWIEEASCSHLRATHLLEHFSHRDTVEVLENWLETLEPGGELYVEVPNVKGHIQAWWGSAMSATIDASVMIMLYGEQDHDGNFHKAGFTEKLLKQRLEDAGFEDVKVQDIGMVLNAWGTRPKE